jgi:hypothetical protein
MRSSLTAANILKHGADQGSAMLQNERGSRRRANYMGVVPLRGARQERKNAIFDAKSIYVARITLALERHSKTRHRNYCLKALTRAGGDGRGVSRAAVRGTCPFSAILSSYFWSRATNVMPILTKRTTAF